MKLFSLVLSIIVFFISLYFFSDKVSEIYSLNDFIYVSLLGILMTICITGIIINWDILIKNKKNKLMLFVSNNFSKKTKRLQ
ncbi:hypothetical protein [Flavobacterium litorale]|uniref:Uncharacterized protein n=1 Tax=Flavobacterium litorale TaxID=2856519 RepID=A0ABX8V5D2_9FLAO|nr:hypothetical protein [Flavobacterium litorale]QYJ67697.1 hypothetical protein K1I41_09090 [Flavobacterium litorale]